jgi:hypothetical protein
MRLIPAENGHGERQRYIPSRPACCIVQLCRGISPESLVGLRGWQQECDLKAAFPAIGPTVRAGRVIADTALDLDR